MNEAFIFKLSQIIVRYLRGEATSDEIILLNSWKEATPENNYLLNYFSNNYFLDSHLISEILCDKKGAYRQFIKRKRRFLLRRKLLIGFSSAAAVILIFWFSQILLNISTDSIGILTPLIEPGESSAVLTLEDGKQILLGKGESDTLLYAKGIQVKNTSACLSYLSTGSCKEDMPCHLLDIPRKGEYQIVLSDSTRVWLNSESRLRYPVVFEGEERRVWLEGEAYFKVKENKAVPFIITMLNNMSMKVLGTSFNIRAYSDEQSFLITLVEGKVEIQKGTEKLLLYPSEQGILDIETNSLSKQTVNVQLYTSWKEGRFVFENQTLEEIMNTLKRWYDINVFFDSEKVKKATYIGNIERYSDFNKVKELFEMTGVAQFTIKENNIYISEQEESNK